MKQTDACYQKYIHILQEELIPAMGCTEPIAIAYAAAKARGLLGMVPERVTVAVSGNILKNVKSVVVPNTGGLRGIEAAAAAGIIGGKEELALEVLSEITAEQKVRLHEFLRTVSIQVVSLDTTETLDCLITVAAADQEAKVRIAKEHDAIVWMEKNGQSLPVPQRHHAKHVLSDHGCLNVEDIISFADAVCVEDVQDLLERQIQYNYAIAEEGMRHDYGANVGKVLLNRYGNDIQIRARAMAAAGSDARMNGCELPVIIVSGSGNQGITASVPVIEYAKHWGKTKEELYRALVVSDLITLHVKAGIGRLSAYCGVICAGSGAGCGIAYLNGGRYDAIAHTLVNALAIVSGIICDGAKASCAGKIASAVDAGILGYMMYEEGQQFYGGDGIVSKGVENTIHNVGRLGSEGMKETDKEIIKMMLGC